MGGGISYEDVLKFCKEAAGGSKYNGSLILSENEVNELDRFLCLDNHFFHVIKLPEFKICFLSSTVKDVLGYDPNELTLRKIYSLIHPDDYKRTLESTIRMLEVGFRCREELKPLKNVKTMEYRIRDKKGEYKRIFSQNCIFSTGPGPMEFKAISFNTDISFHQEYLNSDGNEALRHLEANLSITENKVDFTPRELEILELLAEGFSSEKIGNTLNISRHTVDTHRRKMLSKSGLKNTTELIANALLNNIIDMK